MEVTEEDLMQQPQPLQPPRLAWAWAKVRAAKAWVAKAKAKAKAKARETWA